MKALLKSVATVIVTAVCMTTFFTSCADEKDNSKYDMSATGVGKDISMSDVVREIDSMDASDFEAYDGESDYVLIKVRNYGDIVVVLRGDVAPVSVANFKKLVRSGFYGNTIFHRVINDFMIQGGGITVVDGKWKQKTADSINGEFALNGVTNNLKHVRGVISMARANDPDSASSQFFIMHADTASLNGSYAAFGYVLAGMDVVDAIAACKVDGSSPVEDVVIESVTFVKIK